MMYTKFIKEEVVIMRWRVAFICIHNSCRSQMAEGWAKHLYSDVLDVYSAGTESYPAIKPKAVEVMEEKGVNMQKQYPKTLEALPNAFDVVITMGCGVECPYIPFVHREDWGLDDPSGGPLDAFRQTRDIIERRVHDLVDRLKTDTL